MASFADRMLGAARLDGRTYEEVEQDRTATAQALGVCAIGWVLQIVVFAILRRALV